MKRYMQKLRKNLADHTFNAGPIQRSASAAKDGKDGEEV